MSACQGNDWYGASRSKGTGKCGGEAADPGPLPSTTCKVGKTPREMGSPHTRTGRGAGGGGELQPPHLPRPRTGGGDGGGRKVQNPPDTLIPEALLSTAFSLSLSPQLDTMVRFLVLLGLLGGAMAAPAPAGDVDGDFQIEAYLANAKMHTVQSEEQQAAGQPNGTETGALERRWSWSDINVLCGGRWENKDRWALSRGIDEGMSYLAKHGGQPHMDPGPSACGRVSCSWNTAVFLCNDVSHGRAPKDADATAANERRAEPVRLLSRLVEGGVGRGAPGLRAVRSQGAAVSGAVPGVYAGQLERYYALRHVLRDF